MMQSRSGRLLVLLPVLAALAAASRLAAQPADTGAVRPADSIHSPAPFRFAGMARIYGQVANRRGTYQLTPDDFARLELRPSLLFYNIPFTVNLLLSTEQSELRQNINSLSFDFDYHRLEGELLERAYTKLGEIEDLKALSDEAGGVEHLRDSLERVGSDRLADLERLKDYDDLEKIKDHALSESLDKLSDLGIISDAEKFFAQFPALSVGVTYPQYTALTLNAVPVTGFNIEWNPGNFYIAAAGGKAQRAIVVPGAIGNVPGVVDSVLINPAYTRTLYAARIGYGKKEGGHVILTGIYAKDDQSSLPKDTIGVPLTPSANYVLGLDVNVPIVEDYLTVQGEIAGSMLTGDISAAQIASNDIPDFVRSTVDPNISSLLDVAYSVKSQLHIPESDTRLTASLRKIGPVYFSLGVPTLRNDNVRWEGRLEQRFVKGRVSAAVYYKRDADNLYPGLKATVSTVTSYGVALGLTFPKLPYLRVNYSPYQQHYSRPEDTAEVENTTTLISASTGYNYRIGSLTAGTTASISSQQSNTYQGLSDYGVTTIALGQNLTFSVPLALQLGLTTSGLTSGDSTQRIISADIAGSYTAFGTWTNTLGLSIADQQGADNSLGFSLASALQIGESTYIEARAEKNVYKNLLITASNFDEFLFTASVTTTW